MPKKTFFQALEHIWERLQQHQSLSSLKETTKGCWGGWFSSREHTHPPMGEKKGLTSRELLRTGVGNGEGGRVGKGNPFKDIFFNCVFSKYSSLSGPGGALQIGLVCQLSGWMDFALQECGCFSAWQGGDDEICFGVLIQPSQPKTLGKSL